MRLSKSLTRRKSELAMLGLPLHLLKLPSVKSEQRQSLPAHSLTVPYPKSEQIAIINTQMYEEQLNEFKTRWTALLASNRRGKPLPPKDTDTYDPAAQPTFYPFSLDETGLRADLSEDEYPTAIYTWDCADLELPEGATYYGIVTEGHPCLLENGQINQLRPGQFFVVEGPAKIAGEFSRGLAIARLGYLGYPQIGGPLEARGRLKYIDGCSDTLLVCPPVVGEPCLNHLHIPERTCQTAHTHPSQRIGVILRGSGYCLTPSSPEEVAAQKPFETYDFEFRNDGSIWKRTELTAGMGWWIPTGLLHSFHTGAGETLDVVAWHPNSDFGPTHDNHPMVNLTIVDGQSVAGMKEIRTKEIEG